MSDMCNDNNYTAFSMASEESNEMINPIEVDKTTQSENDEIKRYTLKQCIDHLTAIGDYIYELDDKEKANLLDQISNRILDLDRLKDEENTLGKIISDEIYSAQDLVAEVYGEDVAEGISEDISWEEFEESFPGTWTYPLSEMDECLRNNEDAVIVRFFDQSKEDGFVYRVADLNETIQM